MHRQQKHSRRQPWHVYGRLWAILAHDNSMCWHTQAWEFVQVCGTLTMSWGFSFSSRGVFPGSAVMDSALSIVIVMMLAVTSCGWHGEQCGQDGRYLKDAAHVSNISSS